MYLIARPPNMLPTHTLTGTNSTGQTSSRKRSVRAELPHVKKRSSASVSASTGILSVAGSALAVAVLGLSIF